MQRSIIYFIIAFHICICSPVWAQKKKLDLSEAAIWPYISAEKITDKGNYASYIIGSQANGDTLVIRSLISPWERKYLHSSGLQFSANSRLAVFRSKGDTLCLITLGTDSIEYIPHVSSYKLASGQRQDWLACQLKDSTRTLLLWNLLTGTKLIYTNVTDYLFSDNGSVLLLQTSTNTAEVYELALCDLLSGRMQVVSKGSRASDFSFDRLSKQFAFLRISSRGNTLWYCKLGMDSAIRLVDSATPGMSGYSILDRGFPTNTIYIPRLYLDAPFFSGDGRRIFFVIRPNSVVWHTASGDTLSKVSIWNYLDEVVPPNRVLPHDQAVQRKSNNGLLAVLNLSDMSRIIPLQQLSDDGTANLDNNDSANYLITKFSHPVSKESKWRSYNSIDISLVSINDGRKIWIVKNIPASNEVTVSTSGRYVIWYERAKRAYFCYNIRSGATRNITSSIPEPIYKEEDVGDLPASFGVGGWLKDDTAILIYDQYDIWQVDPEGKRRAIDLTGGIGKKTGVMFRIMNFDKDATIPAVLNDTLYLCALNDSSRSNGFYRMTVSKPGRPLKLGSGSGMAYFPQRYSFDILGVADWFYPIKAKAADVWLMKVMSPSEYPNLSVTHDFRTVQRLTVLEPQMRFKWYTSSLLHWKLPDGKIDQGILYKPEDFSPDKKYPIIFFYYEKNADAVNSYLYPELSPGTLNIPWFVSHGYLVFVPDIQFKVGYPGQSVLNCVVSAAKYLMGKPWVDGNRMGIEGHSFGGYETNYIVSKTHLFAAAVSAAGTTDIPIAYGDASSVDWMNFFEFSQGRIGADIGTRPALYALNSPILNAGNVSTPLLIMSNKADYAVMWYQDLSWFAILQHLGKKVWLLQYDGEGHVLFEKHNQMDYSIRMGQFFDYYLKGMPPPIWMTGEKKIDGKE